MATADQVHRKDIWDKIGVLGGPLIALVGLLFTHVYQSQQHLLQTKHEQEVAAQQAVERKSREDLAKRQLTLQRLDTVQHFFNELAGRDEERRKAALLLISSAGDEQLAVMIADLNRSKGTDEALNKIYSTNTQFTAPRSGSEPKDRRGFAYIGQFDWQNSTWVKTYVVVPAGAKPDDLIGTSVIVQSETGDLSVRSEMPSGAGSLPPVIDIVPSGRRLKVSAIGHRADPRFIWAAVHYRQ